MTKTSPKNLNEAIAAGVELLDDKGKAELALLGYIDPHTRYGTDFINLIGSEMGILDLSNKMLLEDISLNHTDSLHFLDVIGMKIEPSAAVRIVLIGMAKYLNQEKI